MSIRLSRWQIAILACVLVASVFLVRGCSTSESEESVTDTAVEETDTAVEETEPAPPEETEPAPVPEEDSLYTPTYQLNGSEIAAIETDQGVIKFEFYGEDAPNHAAAFIELSQKGFYDGTKFHRVEPGFVVQGGDPLSKTDDPRVGTGGPGYMLEAEFNSRQHLDGTVAMARSTDPNSAGSQFYICLGPQPFLDGQYTVFGQVTEGMDIIRSITVGDVMNSVIVENASE